MLVDKQTRDALDKILSSNRTAPESPILTNTYARYWISMKMTCSRLSRTSWKRVLPNTPTPLVVKSDGMSGFR